MTDSMITKLTGALARGLSAPSEVEARAMRLAAEEYELDDDAARWQALFDEDGDGRDMLAELLLFPDRELRLAVEPLLAERDWTEADASALAGALGGTRARFTLPQGAEFSFALQGEEAQTMVRRLKPLRSTPPEVRAAAGRLPEPLALEASVRLRLARFPWNGRTSFCLSTLFMRLAGEGDFAELLDVLCLFLEVHHGEEDLAAAMIRRREEAERQLKNHLAFQQRLAGSNFETMHLTGDRAVHADPDALSAEMRALDRLCPALFGRAAVNAPMELDLGAVNGQGAVDDMLRLIGGG